MTEMTALAVAGDDPTGRGGSLMRLASMSEQEFTAQVEVYTKALDRLERIKTGLLKPGVDYGVIPGTEKPTMLQPGAEKLCFFMRLVPVFACERIIGDAKLTPILSYVVTCRLHVGSEAGPVVATGMAECNSWERRYRYRRGERLCPSCSKPAIRRSKYDDKDTGKKGWYCHDKAGGCNAKFAADDTAIVDQVVGDIDNPDPFDLANTLIMIGQKRAFVKATRIATASSDRFTQDIEDGAGEQGQESLERERVLTDIKAVCDKAGLRKIGQLYDAVQKATGRNLMAGQMMNMPVFELRTVLVKLRDHLGQGSGATVVEGAETKPTTEPVVDAEAAAREAALMAGDEDRGYVPGEAS